MRNAVLVGGVIVTFGAGVLAGSLASRRQLRAAKERAAMASVSCVTIPPDLEGTFYCRPSEHVPGQTALVMDNDARSNPVEALTFSGTAELLWAPGVGRVAVALKLPAQQPTVLILGTGRELLNADLENELEHLLGPDVGDIPKHVRLEPICWLDADRFQVEVAADEAAYAAVKGVYVYEVGKTGIGALTKARATRSCFGAR